MTDYSSVGSGTLLALYAIMLVGVLKSQTELLLQGHRVFHYKSLFNLFVILWMALRVAFWLVDLTNADLPELLQDLIFWAPGTAMFLTFATLALFLAKVARGPAWSGALRRRYLWAYGVVAAINVASTVTFSVLDAQYVAVGDGDAQNAIQNSESVETAILFLILAGVFAYLGRQVRRLGVWEYGRSSFMLPPRAVSTSVTLLAGVFASRAVWNVLTASGVVEVSTGDASLRSALLTVGLYVLWELTPLALLLATIASGARGSAASAAVKGTAHLGVFEAIDELEHEMASAAAAGEGGGGAAGGDGTGGPGGGSETGAADALGQPGEGAFGYGGDSTGHYHESAPMLGAHSTPLPSGFGAAFSGRGGAFGGSQQPAGSAAENSYGAGLGVSGGLIAGPALGSGGLFGGTATGLGGAYGGGGLGGSAGRFGPSATAGTGRGGASTGMFGSDALGGGGLGFAGGPVLGSPAPGGGMLQSHGGVSLAGAGFLSAQQQAMRRSAYIPPVASAMGYAAGGGPGSSDGAHSESSSLR